ncbi:hypothetical protein WEH80_34060 [Actinomycetes bacterium KLBMP 9759]
MGHRPCRARTPTPTELLPGRLLRARRQRFTGLREEIDELLAALRAEVPPSSVMVVHRPGGIGTSSLLAGMGDEAAKPPARHRTAGEPSRSADQASAEGGAAAS